MLAEGALGLQSFLFRGEAIDGERLLRRCNHCHIVLEVDIDTVPRHLIVNPRMVLELRKGVQRNRSDLSARDNRPEIIS